MPKPYSLDLRARILKDYDSGVPVEDLVAHYEVSRSWTYSLIKKRNETGSIAPRVHRPGRKKKLGPHEQVVRSLIAAQPDATLAEFCEKLSEHVSISTAGWEIVPVGEGKTMTAKNTKRPNEDEVRYKYTKDQPNVPVGATWMLYLSALYLRIRIISEDRRRHTLVFRNVKERSPTVDGSIQLVQFERR